TPGADGEQALAEVEPAYPPGLRDRPRPVAPFWKDVGGQTQGRWRSRSRGVPTTPGGPAPNPRGQLMYETLLTAEWKKVLGSSPPPDAAPLTKKLEGYAKLKGKADPEDEAQALQEINVLALSLKKKLARDAKVVGHLDRMAKGALDVKKKVEA